MVPPPFIVLLGCYVRVLDLIIVPRSDAFFAVEHPAFH